MGMQYGCGAFGGSPSYNDPGEDRDEEERDELISAKNEQPLKDDKTDDEKIPLSAIFGTIFIILGAIGFITSIISNIFFMDQIWWLKWFWNVSLILGIVGFFISLLISMSTLSTQNK